MTSSTIDEPDNPMAAAGAGHRTGTARGNRSADAATGAKKFAPDAHSALEASQASFGRQDHRCCCFWWPRSFWLAFFVGYVPHHRRDLQVIAEANVQNDALPDVTVVVAKKASTHGRPGSARQYSGRDGSADSGAGRRLRERRYVDIGDRVTAGQLLAEVEAPDLDQQVRQAQAAVEQAQADLARASAALEQGKANESIAQVTATRWDNLVKRGAVSKQENDQYQAQYQAQAANVRALERAVDAAKGNISAMQANVGRLTDMQGYLKVRAPFAGVVTLRNVDVGTLVNTGSTMLFRIAQTNLLRTYLNVPQSSASDVHVGQMASLATPELPERKFSGAVTRTANALDPSSRTLLVEVQVPNPEGKLLPGMYVEVDLHLPRKDPPLLLPSDTLSVRPQGTLVAVLDPNNAVHFQRVVIGRDYGSSIEILSGLSAGQRVIANPNDSVQEGVKVHPVVTADGTGGGSKRSR